MQITKEPSVSTHYHLRRVGNVDLEFDGTVIAEESSKEEGKDRWTEVRVYRTDKGRWVTEVRGCSLVEDEEERIRATACRTPEEVVKSFRLWSPKRKTYYFTNIALDALDAAAEADPRLRDAIKETA